MKIAPEHWRRDNIGRILDPWGNVSLPYLLGDGIFGISLREIPQGRCQKIVSAISSAFKNTGRTQLDRIWFLDGGLLTGPWPAATFVQECHEGINTEVYFFFHVCSRN
jgi:hypothetical protein